MCIVGCGRSLMWVLEKWFWITDRVDKQVELMKTALGMVDKKGRSCANRPMCFGKFVSFHEEHIAEHDDGDCVIASTCAWHCDKGYPYEEIILVEHMVEVGVRGNTELLPANVQGSTVWIRDTRPWGDGATMERNACLCEDHFSIRGCKRLQMGEYHASRVVLSPYDTTRSLIAKHMVYVNMCEYYLVSSLYACMSTSNFELASLSMRRIYHETWNPKGQTCDPWYLNSLKRLIFIAVKIYNFLSTAFSNISIFCYL